MSRYARQICLPEIGAAGQERLAAARVLIVGAGGLAASLLPALVGAGVGASAAGGRIELVDHDRVELGNLHRQTVFSTADIDQPKAVCAARAMAALNAECHLMPQVARMDPVLARAMITRGAFDLVLDAADSFALTYSLSDICAATGTPLISASVLARAGMVGGFCGGAPSYRAVFPDLPPRMQTCAEAGVMGPAVMMMGALQAQMALSVLLGHQPSPLGQMMSVDLAAWRVSTFRFDGAEEETAQRPQIVGLSEITPEDTVIELRGMIEAPVPAVAQALRILPDALDGFTPQGAGRIVLACASGLRAWHGARRLAQRWPNPVAIVAVGG